ncbi:MAG TPA: MFS transporter [Vicinamibacterales bacterium]|nr:MFS transporter [Vicinamibacterales bacterium]
MLALVAAAELLGMTLWFSATAVAPAIVAEFALDNAALAWLTMAVQGGFVAGTLLTAATNLADAVNARRLFAAGCVIGAAANAAITLAPSTAVIIALRFCTGAALAWVYPPGMKIVAGWFLQRRGTALGIVVGAVGLGSALPHLLNWIGASLPWRLLITTSSVLALAGAMIVGLAVKDGPHVSPSAPFDRHALRVVLRSRGTRLAMLGYFGHMWELYAVWTWIAAFASASLAGAGGTGTGSLVAFVTIASGAVGCVLAGRWADEFGKARIAGAAMVASAACVLLTPVFYGGPLALLLALAVVWGFTVVADSAQFSALVTDYTARTHVGTALTLQTSAGFLLTMVSMRLVPPVSSMAGWRWAFLFLAPGPLLGALAMRRLK